MDAHAIGTLAFKRQRESGDVPDTVIVAELATVGVVGEMFDPAYREAYEACERVWRGLMNASEGRVCGREGCDSSLVPRQARYCSRACWQAELSRSMKAKHQQERAA